MTYSDVHTAPTRYRALIEELPEGVLVADADRRLVLANRRADKLTGLELTPMLRRDIREVLPFIGMDGRSYWVSNDPWGGLRTRSGSPEHRLMLPDGRSVLAVTRHVRDGERNLQWLIMTLRSSTARDRMESETSALVTTVAHELRSPLGAVRGFAQSLRSRWSQLREDQRLWMLGAIEADAARLQRQVGDLLDASRLDSGRLQLRRHDVDLLSLVRSAVERMASIGYDPARFVISSDRAEIGLFADPDRLAQVLSNLLENAVRHGDGAVTVTVTSGGDEVRLDVGDEGPGIAPEHRALIFSRFWQGRGQRGGSGLGLFVVHGLVTAHGGRVEVLEQRHGATIRVTLPVAGGQ
jgi:signal transduction histidine kinase